ncbi:MAG: putative DNA-binding domain-containing protein [Gammaproteobacteria bacterium]|nr:putative DNA-binding domain-containing protein [Gammaproteobacteria bacterium]
MSGLASLQREFQRYVTGASDTRPAQVTSDDIASAEQRLGIYTRAIQLRFLEVLDSDYPGLHTLLGDAGFAELGRAYAEAHPSRYRSIRWYGQHMAAFLRRCKPWSGQPVLAEMAEFEWRKGELVDAVDAPRVQLAAIAAVPPEAWAAMRPRLAPATRRLTLQWNVPALWRAAQSEAETHPSPIRGEQAREWLLWRNDLELKWRSLEPDEVWALDACRDGATFGDLCEGLCALVGEEGAPLRAATFLKQWTVDGLLCSIDAGVEPTGEDGDG